MQKTQVDYDSQMALLRRMEGERVDSITSMERMFGWIGLTVNWKKEEGDDTNKTR